MKPASAMIVIPYNQHMPELFEKFLDMLNDLDDVQNVYHDAESYLFGFVFIL